MVPATAADAPSSRATPQAMPPTTIPPTAAARICHHASPCSKLPMAETAYEMPCLTFRATSEKFWMNKTASF